MMATVQLRERQHIRDLKPIGRAAAQDSDDTLLREDREPRPSKILLATLSACFTVSIQANAVERRVPSLKLVVHSRGDEPLCSVWGAVPRQVRPIGSWSITVEVPIEPDVPLAALKWLVDHTVLWSPVANMLHDPVGHRVDGISD